MRYIEPSFSEITLSDPFKKIAYVAHNCYQVDKDTDQEAFVGRLIASGHYAMIEHFLFKAEVSPMLYKRLIELNDRFLTLAEAEEKFYLSFSLRPLLEGLKGDEKTLGYLAGLLPSDCAKLLKAVPEPGEGRLLKEEELAKLPYETYKEMKDVSLKIITDRGVTHELVRHRIASYAQESTRYCNYAKDKFGNELTFIKPIDYQAHKDTYDSAFKNAEASYFALLKEGATPEMARAVLPNKLKAAIVITASVSEYEKIFALRTGERAHPDMRQVMIPIKDYFCQKGYLHD
jgi:thymidylate synthase (FAD)